MGNKYCCGDRTPGYFQYEGNDKHFLVMNFENQGKPDQILHKAKSMFVNRLKANKEELKYYDEEKRLHDIASSSESQDSQSFDVEIDQANGHPMETMPHTEGPRLTFNDDEGGSVSMNTLGQEKSQLGIPQETKMLKTSFDFSEYNSYDSNNEDFNADYAMALLERFQEMSEEDDWDLKVDDDNIRVWLAIQGSFLNQELPFIHAEVVLDERFPFDLIVEALNDPNRKKLWDDTIENIEIMKNLSLKEVLYHTVYKPYEYVATQRDFIEKKLTFTTKNIDQEDVVIVLSSSIPDEYCPPKNYITRCETLFHMMIFEPQTDGSTIVQCYSQIDTKLDIMAQSTIDRTIEKMSSRWYSNLIQYLEKQAAGFLFD